jgi:hypothetical protein
MTEIDGRRVCKGLYILNTENETETILCAQAVMMMQEANFPLLATGRDPHFIYNATCTLEIQHGPHGVNFQSHIIVFYNQEF